MPARRKIALLCQLSWFEYHLMTIHSKCPMHVWYVLLPTFSSASCLSSEIRRDVRLGLAVGVNISPALVLRGSRVDMCKFDCDELSGGVIPPQ